MTRIFPVTALALLALIPASCTKTDSAKRTETEAAPVTLTLKAPSSPVSRTWIDSGVGGSTLPVYWSAGDRIAVNGVVSSPLSIEEGAKVSSAEFQLRNISAPYSAVYPHSAYCGTDDAGNIILQIPASQAWKEGSFAEGSALLYGYSENDASPLQMKNLCGAVSFSLKDENEVQISSLTITSLTDGKPIAGQFVLDGKSLALTAAQGGSDTVSMTFPEQGLTISAEGTSFFFTIPAGNYPEGFLIRLDDARKHILRSLWLRPSEGAEAGVEVGAGKIVVFDTAVYDPDAREICSPEDWEEFAQAYNSGSEGWEQEWLCKDGSIKIGADFSAEELTKINTLSHTLEGNGHTVTISAARTPLVGKLTGAIKNLTIAGSNTPDDPGTAGATVFVTTLAEGSIENCTSKAGISLANYSGKLVAGSFVRTFSGGSIINCNNEGNLTFRCDISAGNQAILGGGFVGTVSALAGAGLIKGCTNKGNISFTFIKPSSSNHYPAQAGFGGIVGTIVNGTAENFLTIESCTNEGSVSVEYANDPTTASVMMSAAGGIVGAAMKYNSSTIAGTTTAGGAFWWWKRSNLKTDVFDNQDGVYFEMKDCISKGDIRNGLVSSTSSDEPLKAYSAGLVGVVNGLGDSHCRISGCSVSGSIIPYEGSTYSRAAFAGVCGGLAGFAGYADFEGCSVNCQQIGTLKKQFYATSGAIGIALMSFKLTNCKIFANLQIVRAINYTADNYAAGFGLSTKCSGSSASGSSVGGMRWTMIDIDGSSVSGCGFGGSITYNSTPVNYNASSGFTPVETVSLTSSNIENYIASPSFRADYDGKGFPSKVTISDNYWWNAAN